SGVTTSAWPLARTSSRNVRPRASDALALCPHENDAAVTPRTLKKDRRVSSTRHKSPHRNISRQRPCCNVLKSNVKFPYQIRKIKDQRRVRALSLSRKEHDHVKRLSRGGSPPGVGSRA